MQILVVSLPFVWCTEGWESLRGNLIVVDWKGRRQDVSKLDGRQRDW
jgi:hypothetical protein